MATTTTTVPSRLPFGLRLPDAISVLGERDFRVVWFGQAVSMTGTWMQAIAQGLVVLELWNSAFALSAVNFANAVPSLAVMLFGGVLADRADKRKILIVTQFVMMMLALTVGVLIAFDAVAIWMIIACTVLLGVAFGYDMPAYQSYLPDLVPQEKITQVVSLNSSTFHGTRMVGPAIAGYVIKAFGTSTAYFLNAFSFLAVILSLLIVRHRPAPPAVDKPRTTALEDLRAGFKHAGERPNLQALMILTALACTFLFPFMAILSPYYVKNVLDADAGVLGLIWAASGIGSLIGALALIWWPKQWRAQRIWLAALAGPAFLAIMAWTRDPAVAILCAGVTSISFSSQLNMFQSMIQESTPPSFRGRVGSLFGITFNGTMPISGLASAGLAVWIGLPWVMAGAAGVYLLLVAGVLLFVAGGIAKVVASTAVEFEAVAAAQGATAGARR